MDGVLFPLACPFVRSLFSSFALFLGIAVSVLFDRAFHRWIPENWESGATRRVFLKIVNSFKTGY